MAEARAKRRSLEASEAERKEAIAKIERQLLALGAQARDVAGRAPDAVKLAAITEEGQRLAREGAEIEDQALAAEERAHALAAGARTANEASAKARLVASALTAERTTLLKLVAPSRDDGLPPVLEAMRVAPGYEAALIAALGDDLEAPTAEAAPVHWRRLDVPSADGALPVDAEPLGLHVEAPPELARRLKQIGIVAREVGPRLQPHLKPGQRLVSLEGDLWRWDGFAAAAGGATPPPSGSRKATASPTCGRRKSRRARLPIVRTPPQPVPPPPMPRPKPRSGTCASAGARRKPSLPKRARR